MSEAQLRDELDHYEQVMLNLDNNEVVRDSAQEYVQAIKTILKDRFTNPLPPGATRTKSGVSFPSFSFR